LFAISKYGGRRLMTKELERSIPGLDFLREAKAELKKVTWPGKMQIWYSTLIVIVFTFCMSFYLGIVDFLLTLVFSSIL
jgi:preprotein translocase subunit SecE